MRRQSLEPVSKVGTPGCGRRYCFRRRRELAIPMSWALEIDCESVLVTQ
jgi:hypothetical protein